MIGKSGERGSGISVQPARHDVNRMYMFSMKVYLFVYVFLSFVYFSSFSVIFISLIKN